ncbi:Deoxyribonuclease V [Thermodesulfatator indicus DSM 15286]|uniref:Endonuclease V n=1 Tax=Thermodesulfatator indicus (strain DSM 15286 / JCM 11887 / CIR29812) TaxID=667014 RepID=F8A9V2_THEID|nr:endonuclease V [Thermodesulfatator indicus]AEH44150.1 Deoxyribonuclease V [Thermodesulfatator indicus DSM 15286]
MPGKLDDLKTLQKNLARQIKLAPLSHLPRLIGGADVSYIEPGYAIGAVVVYDLEKGKVIEETYAVEKVTFPYIPGFLSFREVPVLKKAFAKLKIKPEVLLVDGQGILHPRGLGLASHLGLELNIPTIGVAKKPLIGEFELPEDKPGAFCPIFINGQVKGVVLRTRKGVKPVFVSPGHLIDLESALKVVKASLSGYRIPEPLRKAHLLTQRLRGECRNNSGWGDRQ